MTAASLIVSKAIQVSMVSRDKYITTVSDYTLTRSMRKTMKNIVPDIYKCALQNQSATKLIILVMKKEILYIQNIVKPILVP